ncbi:hypothetical protein EDD80_101135 [Anseongella ginsenosidimutans]|uniref:Lactobin A/cerein 7B family class IIb bacteriocin n=1 Tax=Anseongella ginsenosidimutans TaxID=496056 RepID=A0A4R3KX07_9SPHI|nr:hypothetical protein [Anseongella ginsenosidimutans]QEC51361.1 hypothetical protein FRZ59_02680 [Anseongella ginsenosidimutans]TCS89938.1 hypothetical protein EDD80_101135 [Anseongella ginsenosidimutans]
MKNTSIENTVLVSLSEDELRAVNGGLVFWTAVAAGVCISAITEIISDWDNFKAGLSGRCEG